ncbi:MAG TPA: aminotransferase class V-fold PLP-dependent enzyme [Jiangellaceae bacterium]|nr:aminotransferase class V-fold PLP-dependent enzyme [Jiangellaceae bacterium]
MATDRALDADRIRRHFDFLDRGRIVTNNAASTQPPRELLRLYRELVPSYENVHRGQSTASQAMTELFECSYDTIAAFINAPGRRNIVICRNTTEALNSVMYSLLTQFRDGDNVVTTLMEHNSNYVPWYALCREILPKFGIRVECRLARFDPVTGALDLDHLTSLVDQRTKLVCCTGASNFLGTKPPLQAIRAIADGSGYSQPHGEDRSLLVVDGAQLVPNAAVDVQDLDVDYLAFSFHKMLAPFGIGVLYGKEHLLRTSAPFLYGGDMIAPGQVTPDHVGYNDLPWKYAAGTPNILGTIVSAEALRLLLDLVLEPPERYFRTERVIDPATVRAAFSVVGEHTRALTTRALEVLSQIDGLTVYGPRNVADRTSLVAFTVAGWNPMHVAEQLNIAGIEARAGCHCATLAHDYLRLDPPGSCRLSFALYNTIAEVEYATAAVREIVGHPVAV